MGLPANGTYYSTDSGTDSGTDSDTDSSARQTADKAPNYTSNHTSNGRTSPGAVRTVLPASREDQVVTAE